MIVHNIKRDNINLSNHRHTTRTNLPYSTNPKQYELELKNIKKLIKETDTIVEAYGDNIQLLKDIYYYLNENCTIIKFNNDLDSTLDLRNFFNKDGIIIVNNDFKQNDLKPDIANVVIAKNIFFENSDKLIKEAFGILKPGGNFLFSELVSFNKAPVGFKTYFKNDKLNIFNNVVFEFKQKLKLLKSCDYEIKIIGNGNYYFNLNDINSLQEYCDNAGLTSYDRNYILSNILAVIIVGKYDKND